MGRCQEGCVEPSASSRGRELEPKRSTQSVTLNRQGQRAGQLVELDATGCGTGKREPGRAGPRVSMWRLLWLMAGLQTSRVRPPRLPRQQQHERPDTAEESAVRGSGLPPCRSGQIWSTPSIRSSLVPG